MRQREAAQRDHMAAIANGARVLAQAQAQSSIPLDYPSLLALVKQTPLIIHHLPPAYQQHFSQILGIPCPDPSPAPPVVNGSASNGTTQAAPRAPRPVVQAAPVQAVAVKSEAPTPIHGDIAVVVDSKPMTNGDARQE
jgi:hypothetical protein